MRMIYVHSSTWCPLAFLQETFPRLRSGPHKLDYLPLVSHFPLVQADAGNPRKSWTETEVATGRQVTPPKP